MGVCGDGRIHEWVHEWANVSFERHSGLPSLNSDVGVGTKLSIMCTRLIPNMWSTWRYKLAFPTSMTPSASLQPIFILNSHFKHEWEIFRHVPFQKTTGRRLFKTIYLCTLMLTCFLYTQWTYKPVCHCPWNYCAMCLWSGAYEAEATREGVVCHRFGPW